MSGMITLAQAQSIIDQHSLASTVEAGGWLALRDLRGDHIDSVKITAGGCSTSALRQALGY